MLLASHETRRPVQTLSVVMSTEKRVSAKLKKMAPIFEPKFANDGL